MRAALTAIAIWACCCAEAVPIHDAAAKGDLSIVAGLLEAGSDVNSQGDNGETVLNLAVLNGNVALTELLLSRGARLDSRNAGGFIALHAAAYAGNREIEAMLLDRGAEIDDQSNKAGVSALSIASEENRPRVAALFLERGASIELADNNAYPCLVVSDNGTELTSNAILKWQEDHKVGWNYIAPNKPMQYGHVEDFNGPLPQRAPSCRSALDRIATGFVR